MAVIWTRQDKFSPSKGFRRIHWGAQSKVLDTELTELQKILTNQTNVLTKLLITDGFVTKGALVYAATSGGTLTVPIDTLVVGGYSITLEDAMVITGILNTTVYLAMWEQEVAYGDTLYRDGNLSGGQVIADNGIYDTDVATETSRRFQTQVQLVTSNADATKKYIPVASISGAGVVTDNRVQASLTTGTTIASPTGTDNSQKIVNSSWVRGAISTYAPQPNAASTGALGTVQLSASASSAVAVNTVSDVSEYLLTTTAATNVISYPPSAPGNFLVCVSARVITASTNITVEVDYTDAGGAQVNMLYPLASVPVGTHMLNFPLFIHVVAGASIVVKITAGTANQVYISSSLVGV
jgi:hypothetical protein